MRNLALLSLALTVSACAPERLGPDERMTHAAACAHEVPDPQYQACIDRAWSFFDACISVCTTLCEYCVVDDDHCRDRGPRCVEWSHEFQPAAVADPELEAACRRYIERERACGAAVADDPCPVAARIERHEAIETYDCMAATPCGESFECYEPGPRHAVDSTYCSGLSRHGVACTAAERAFLRFVDPWLRDQVVDTLGDACDPPVDGPQIPLIGEEYVGCWRSWYAVVQQAW